LKKSLSLLGGVAVLAFVAVPAVGQSSGKVAPKQVTRKTTPLVAHKYPWTYTTKGKVVLPKGDCPAGATDTTYCTPDVDKTKGCKGKVRVQFLLGTKVISSKSKSVKKDCTYSSSVTFKDKTMAGKRLRVKARFMGNSVLNAKDSAARRVLLARGARGL
jgi:hypothetical protein